LAAWLDPPGPAGGLELKYTQTPLAAIRGGATSKERGREG